MKQSIIIYHCQRYHQAFYEPDPCIERWSPDAATVTWVRLTRGGEEETTHLQLTAIGALRVDIQGSEEEIEEYRRRPEHWRDIQDQAEEMIPDHLRSPEGGPISYEESMESMEEDLQHERSILDRLETEPVIVDSEGDPYDIKIFTRAERITFAEEERMIRFWLRSLGHNQAMLLWPARNQ